MADKVNVVVLISGSGTNLQALIDAAKAEEFPARVALVISNKPDAYGLQRAQEAGIATQVLEHGAYPDREAYDRAVNEAITAAECKIVCLAGFMRLLSGWFVREWQGRMLNIHPSLLPAFKGANAVKDALDYGVKITGCTVHLVTEEVDAGPILTQAAVAVVENDTVESLKSRIHDLEHQIYPATLRWLAMNI